MVEPLRLYPPPPSSLMAVGTFFRHIKQSSKTRSYFFLMTSPLPPFPPLNGTAIRIELYFAASLMEHVKKRECFISSVMPDFRITFKFTFRLNPLLKGLVIALFYITCVMKTDYIYISFRSHL